MNNEKKAISKELAYLHATLYPALGLKVTPLLLNPEGQAYKAAHYWLNNCSVQFRCAKITPKKIDQFVAIWKREDEKGTLPYDESDGIDFLIISVRKEAQFGHFVFPKQALVEKNIFSTKGQGGKRGIRVYPSWDKADNPQAKSTQAWQLAYFLDTSYDGQKEYERAKRVYKFKTIDKG